jgi:hypothetical protein
MAGEYLYSTFRSNLTDMQGHALVEHCQGQTGASREGARTEQAGSESSTILHPRYESGDAIRHYGGRGLFEGLVPLTG